MHFSVEKSGKEVGSGQRFSHLKCIEFITYSQTTAATPPRHLLQPWLPIFFLGGDRVFPCPYVVSIPPPYILHCQQGAESGDDGTRYRTRIPRNEKSRVYHFPLPFIDFTSNRILSPLVTDLSLRPASFPFALFDESRKSFSRFKFKFNGKYLRYLHLAW